MLRTLVPLLFCAGCASSERLELLEREFQAAEARTAPADVDLAQSADLDAIVAVALARYPGLHESLHRARAMGAMARAAGTLDDPMLRLKVDDQPLRRGADLEKVVVGIEQAFPWPGKLDLARESAVGPAEAMLEEHRARELDVVLEVKRTYFEYALRVDELAIRKEHAQLLGALEKLSEARYTAGKVSQQDVLKPQVERGMVTNDLYDIERMIATARARLNLLMDRPPDAPIGTPKIARTSVDADASALIARALQARPEVRAAEARIRGARAAVDLAGKNRSLPDFFVGAEYMQRPDETDEAAVMLGINLPWLSGRRSAEEQASHMTLRAEEAALALARNRITLAVQEAALRIRALDRSLDLIERDLLLRGRLATEAATSGYETALADVSEVLDAQRALRDIRLLQRRALAEREAAVAELERAVGADLRRKP